MQSTPRLNRRFGLIAGAAALVALGAVGIGQFGSHTAQANSPAAAPPATPVSVAQVVSQDLAAWNEFSGRLEPHLQVLGRAAQRRDVELLLAAEVVVDQCP